MCLELAGLELKNEMPAVDVGHGLLPALRPIAVCSHINPRSARYGELPVNGRIGTSLICGVLTVALLRSAADRPFYST
jgi:hypothetical protein